MFKILAFISLVCLVLVSYTSQDNCRYINPTDKHCKRIGRLDTNDLVQCEGFSTLYIFPSNMCDNFRDCPGGEDERNCKQGKKYPLINGIAKTPYSVKPKHPGVQIVAFSS